MIPVEILVALISSLIGGLLVAIVNQIFTRSKTEAEAEKFRAEAEKTRAEAEKTRVEVEKIRTEISKVSSETAKIGDTVKEAASLISREYLAESETSRKLIQEIIGLLHKYLREHKSDRGEREEFIRIIMPILNNDRTMSEFTIDSLISKGYLIETTPGRYEISRTAKQKFISGGAR